MVRFVCYVVLILALGLAAPAHALPVTYGFTTDLSGYTGTFTFDDDTQVGTLGFIAPYPFPAVPLDMSISAPAQIQDGVGRDAITVGPQDFGVWPVVRSAFPVYQGFAQLQLAGTDLFDGGKLRRDLTRADLDLAQISVDVAWVEVFGNTCPTGTALEDCPRSSFMYVSEQGVLFHLAEIHAVPEPGLGALVAASALAVLTTKRRRARRYGQWPAVPAVQVSGHVGQFGPFVGIAELSNAPYGYEQLPHAVSKRMSKSVVCVL
jgi:hypothetical protein